MSWENDAAGYLAELSRSPGGIQPATIGQVWDSEWKRGGLDTIGGVGQPFADARQDLVTAIETASGRPIADYAAEKGVRLGSGVTQADDIRLLGTLADTLPDEHRKKIEPLKDIRLNAAKKAQKIETDADEIGNATYGLSAHATAFIAGVARQAADPVNVAAMVATAPLGAARGASLLATIGREAGANAAAQATVEPIIEPQRERLGLESGFGRAAGNVIEAGIGGGVLSGLFHVAGRGLRSLRGERPAAESAQRAPAEGEVIPPAPEARMAESPSPSAGPSEQAAAGPLTPARPVDQFAPDDFHAAGDLAERDHVIDAMSPVDTAEGRFDHAARVQTAVERIEEIGASPIDGPDAPLSGWQVDIRREAVAAARQLGLTEKIEALAREGRTAADIERAIDERLTQAEIRIVRDHLGIAPSGPAEGMISKAVAPARPVAQAVPANLPILPQGGLIETAGKHGPVVRGLEDRPDDAVAWLRSARTGEVQGAVIHPEIGAIDFVYGERRGAGGGYGIAKIAEEHADFLANIGERLRTMEVTTDGIKPWRAGQEIVLSDADGRAIIKTEWDGEKTRLLFNGFNFKGDRRPLRDTIRSPENNEPAPQSRTQPPEGNIGASAPNVDAAPRGKHLGDPALAADALRAIQAAGGDLEITIINPDGSARTLKASDALREVEDDAHAAAELQACIVGAAEEAT